MYSSDLYCKKLGSSLQLENKGEYISIGADQWPPDQRDWDMESEASVTEGEHDEANMGGENIIINSEPPDSCEWNVESGVSINAGQLGIANMRSHGIHGELRKETLLIEVRDNIEFNEVGATRL